MITIKGGGVRPSQGRGPKTPARVWPSPAAAFGRSGTGQAGMERDGAEKQEIKVKICYKMMALFFSK